MCVCVRRAKSDIVGREIEAASARSLPFHGRCAVRGEWSAIIYIEEYRNTFDSKDILLLGAFFSCCLVVVREKTEEKRGSHNSTVWAKFTHHTTTPERFLIHLVDFGYPLIRIGSVKDYRVSSS